MATMARRVLSVVAQPVFTVLLGLTTSTGADWIAICEVCNVEEKVELNDSHACKDDAHRKRYSHRCSCSASATCSSKGYSDATSVCFASEEAYKQERDQALSMLEQHNARLARVDADFARDARVHCDIGPCSPSGCAPGQKRGGGRPSQLAAADKFGESLGDLERFAAPLLLGQRPNALNTNPAYENWLALRDGGNSGSGAGLYDPKRAKRQAQDRAGWKNSRPTDFGLSDWNHTQKGYRVPETGGKVGKDTLAGWGQPKAVPSSGGGETGGKPTSVAAADSGKGSKVSESPAAEQTPTPQGRGDPAATEADQATGPKPPGSGPKLAEGRELNPYGGVKDKSAGEASRDTSGGGERGIDPAMGRKTSGDRGRDVSDLERAYGGADKAFNKNSARGTRCVDGGNCAPDDMPSLYQSLPGGAIPAPFKAPTKVVEPQDGSDTGSGKGRGGGGGRGGGQGGGGGGGGGGTTGGGGGKETTPVPDSSPGPEPAVPAPAPPALAKAPDFHRPTPRPPEAHKPQPRPARPMEQPKKERRFVPDPAIKRVADKLNHLPPEALREAGRIQKRGAGDIRGAGKRGSPESPREVSEEEIPEEEVPEEEVVEGDEAAEQEAESETAVEQTDCPKADALMDELRLEEALAGYRACLFTDGRERPDAPRWALYQAISGAVRWMKKPPALVQEAKDKLQELSRGQGGRPEAQKAEKTWQRILWLVPWWAEAHYSLAAWHEHRREPQEALLRYRVFLEGAGEEDSRVEEVREKIGEITQSLQTELERASVSGRKGPGRQR